MAGVTHHIIQHLSDYCLELCYLCSVPTAEAPGDAMSGCSGGIQGEGPASHHKTTGGKPQKVHSNGMAIYSKMDVMSLNQENSYRVEIYTELASRSFSLKLSGSHFIVPCDTTPFWHQRRLK